MWAIDAGIVLLLVVAVVVLARLITDITNM